MAYFHPLCIFNYSFQECELIMLLPYDTRQTSCHSSYIILVLLIYMYANNKVYEQVVPNNMSDHATYELMGQLLPYLILHCVDFVSIVICTYPCNSMLSPQYHYKSYTM